MSNQLKELLMKASKKPPLVANPIGITSPSTIKGSLPVYVPIDPHKTYAVLNDKEVEALFDHRDGDTMFQDVLQFHRKFGFHIPLKPKSLSGELRTVKRNHLIEELAEYSNAEHGLKRPKNIRVKELDAIVDLIYVALGVAVLSGYNKFDEAWKRVHAANMKKKRAKKRSESKRGSKFDVVKPAGWEAPVLEDLV